MELSFFILQHSATYSNTLLLKATKMSQTLEYNEFANIVIKNLQPKAPSQRNVVMIAQNGHTKSG